MMTKEQIHLYIMNEIAFDKGLYDEETYKKMELEILNIDKNDDILYN